MPLTLLTVPPLTSFALLLVRLVIGASFMMSGYFKLTDRQRRGKMESSLREAGMPSPVQLAPVVAAFELIGGIGVFFGLLTALAAFIMLVITVVAFVTTIAPKAEGQGIHKLENALFTPEALLIVTLMLVIGLGGGPYSLDAALFRP